MQTRTCGHGMRDRVVGTLMTLYLLLGAVAMVILIIAPIWRNRAVGEGPLPDPGDAIRAAVRSQPRTDRAAVVRKA